MFVMFLFSLLISQRTYAITVTNPSPNPFNPGSGQSTTISFSVDNTQYVTVKIVNCRSSIVNNSSTSTEWRYFYTNIYGGTGAVRYGQEIIRGQVARIYATAGQTYPVPWDGTSDRGRSDIGATYNLCQKGTYYFVVIPENSPQYTIYKPVTITQWNSNYIAYIRQARTWYGAYPYYDDESVGPTVSRDIGKGSNCTGFVTSVIWEMGYSLYYGNFPASGINSVSHLIFPSNQVVKQSYILAWKKPSSSYEHVTIATYQDSYGWHIIHSSKYSYDHYSMAVIEEVTPSWYSTTFATPSVYYWDFIGSVN